MRVACLALSLMLAGLALAAPARAAQFDFRYEASILNVVVLGEGRLQGRATPGPYTASATVRTAGFAAIFDDTRITASAAGRVAANGAFGWSRYDLSHAYANKYRRISMRRGAAGVEATIEPGFGHMGEPPASAAQRNASFDPVTALVAMSAAVAQSNACSGRFAVFDGRGHYTLTLSPKTRGTYRGGGYSGAALVCALRYAPVAGFKMTAAERARIPVGEMWFGTPREGMAPPLRIEVPTPVGPLRVELKALEIGPNTAS